MQYTEQEMLNLIETVEKEFSAHLAKAESTDASLAKSEGSGEAAISKVEEVATEPVQKAEEKAEEHKEEAHPEHKEESKEESKEEHKEESHDEHGYDDEDMEHMHKMYHSMSKGELKAHHAACASALEKCGDIQMQKTEEVKAVEVAPVVEVKAETVETDLIKSENEALKKEIAELKKNNEAVSGFLAKFVEKTTAPAAKAITSLDVIAKSEGTEEKKELTKSEITEILKKKTADISMAKSDRELVNKFYNGASVDTISHLLK